MKNKVYIRIIPKNNSVEFNFDLFEGDIDKDIKYWKKFKGVDTRYFELKEVKPKKRR